MKDLAFKIRKHIGLFLHMQKIDLMNRMEYRINFTIQIITVSLQMIFSLVFISVIFSFNREIAGWNYYEALLVVASYMIIEGVMWWTCAYLSALEKNVRSGTLDGIMLRPVDTQFLVSIWRGDMEDLARVVSGIGVLAYAIHNLSFGSGQLFINLILYAILLFNALVITYSINVFIRSISFWTIENQALFNLSMTFTRITQYPSDIFYHKAVRFFTTYLIPLAFMATVPARILARGFDWRWVLASTLIAAVFFVLSRKFFKFALNSYEGSSI